MAKQDIQEAMEKLGFKKITVHQLRTKSFNEIIEYYNKDSLDHANRWEYWAR